MQQRIAKTPLPWQLPQPVTIEEAREYEAWQFAVQAVAQGRAGEAEQLRFWNGLQRFCGCGRMSFWPGGEDGRRATDFAEGKRFVGDQLSRISKLQPAEFDSRGEPPPMPRAAAAGEDEN